MELDHNYISKNRTDLHEQSSILEAGSRGYEFGKDQNLFFLSEISHDDEILTPRIPNNYMTRNSFENNVTPRVCLFIKYRWCSHWNEPKHQRKIILCACTGKWSAHQSCQTSNRQCTRSNYNK